MAKHYNDPEEVYSLINHLQAQRNLVCNRLEILRNNPNFKNRESCIHDVFLNLMDLDMDIEYLKSRV